MTVPDLSSTLGQDSVMKQLSDAAADSGVDWKTKLTQLQDGASKGFFDNWTPRDYLAAASLGLVAAGTIGNIVGSGGDNTTGLTTVTTPITPGDKIIPGTELTAGEKTFNDYVDKVFNISGTGKSLEARITEDQTALTGYQKTLLDTLTGLDTSRLTGTKEAVGPFQKQITDALAGSAGGTGYFKPFNYSFSAGGKTTPMPGFVPKSQLAEMNAALGIGREGAQLGTGLVDMGYTAGTNLAQRKYGFESENLPNKAAMTYLAKLEDMMKYFNPSGQTSTTTGTVPEVSDWTKALQGLTTGVNLWDMIENPRRGSGITLADLQAWAASQKV